MSALDPVLKRWLKSLGDDPFAGVPDAALWKKFLKRVNGHLEHLQQDRDLLTRSLELSTSEMNELHDRLKSQRDALEQVVVAAADAMGVFREVTTLSADTSMEDVSEAMATARQKFTVKLTEAVNYSDALNIGTSTGSIRGLQNSFMVLADQLMELVSGTSEAAALRKQLEVAGAVQQMLTPEDSAAAFPGVDLAAWFQPAASCGGDWWTANPLDDGRLLVFVGDVTGHGVSSAIITGIVKGACDLARIAGKGGLRVGPLMTMLSRVIFDSARRNYMMTAVAFALDTERMELVMCNAGHPAAWLFRDGKVHMLRGRRDPPLGATPDHGYQQIRYAIEPGDLLFAFTDGVTEYENHSGDQFTEKRLRRLVASISTQTPTYIRGRVLSELAAFGPPDDQEDDITFVVMRVE